jgi:hypothetical protein
MMRTYLGIAAVAGILILILEFLQHHKLVSEVLSSGANFVESDDDGPFEEDKIVVVPKMTGEDTDWLSPDLPE